MGNSFPDVEYTEIDDRLDRMIELADELKLSLDEVVHVLGRCGSNFFNTISDRLPTRPR